MASATWGREPHSGHPTVTIYPDVGFNGVQLASITGVVSATGYVPVEVVFFDEGNKRFAMEKILQEMGRGGAFTGQFTDVETGAHWSP